MSVIARHSRALMLGVSFAALSGAAALAQEQSAQTPTATTSNRVLETVVVTAEKREASVQEVPIAISAFDESKLERLQINDGQDLLLAIPNFQFAKGNFTGTNIAIRGIGSKLVASSADTAVGIHVNGTPLNDNRIFETEFYDVQRVEVLRGPQGTLYGRNASAGIINVITAKPELEELTGAIEGTFGNFDTVKGKGFINLPLGESAALRFAGFFTQRDGFTEVVDGPFRDSRIDGRDMYSVRGSLYWELTDNLDATFMVQYFSEDSDRSRIGKQLCTKDARPFPFSQGCLPTSTRFESPNSSATLGGIFTFLPQLVGAPAAFNLYPFGTDAFAPERNIDNLRQVGISRKPVHQAEEQLFQFELNYDTDWGTFTALVGRQESELNSEVDYGQTQPSVNFLATNPLAPGGLLTEPFTGQTRSLVTYDQSSSSSEQTTIELRFVSDFDGPFNFTLGGINLDYEGGADYKVLGNSLSYFGLFQNAVLGTAWQPDQFYFFSDTQPYELKAWAAFGEAYYNFTDNLKFTLGLRYTDDQKTVTDRQTLFSNGNCGTATAPVTVPSFGLTTACPAGTARAGQLVAPFSTRQVQFQETTGRLGVEWQTKLPFTDETNISVFASRGYKGGGVNPPIDPALFPGQNIPRTFEPEFVDAIEINLKNIALDGRLIANFAAFNYDYQGYQVSKIINRTSVNENIDAKLHGFEAEISWEPIDRLVFDLNAGFISSEIGNVLSVDVADRTAGRTDLTVLKNVNTASNCVVRTAPLNALLAQGGAQVALAACNPATLGGALTPAVLAQVRAAAGIPAAVPFASLPAAVQAQLNAATTAAVNQTLAGLYLPSGNALSPYNLDGIAKNLKGNKLPNTPEYTVSLGGQYTWDLTPEWAMTVRADGYWQADSYSRIYNLAGFDNLDSYSQYSLSVTFNNDENGLYATIFGKNLADEDVITDKYLTDDSSGLFTNVFLLEPRTFGITLGKRW